ncbi:MAG: nicotinate-nucleotide adenylyltransferase [Candidatus Binatia bacterium]
MRGIGVFGGSFDPIHFGHLRAAEEVREALVLEGVVFVPAANPPHKTDVRLVDGALRLRMVELAIADHPRFSASPLEIERGGTSYSVDTLAAMRKPDVSLHFIVGFDAFREIHTWRESERMFEIASVVVISRPPDDLDHSIGHLPVAARKRFCYDSDTQSYRHESGTVLRFLQITAIGISATAIRRRLRDGRSVRYMIPAAVERFVRERRLYGATID